MNRAIWEEGEQANPFVGLRPFESEDSYYYFGRDTQIKALLQRLNSTRFLAVIGSSGSGKSSLVRAGLIPNLEAGFLVQDCDNWLIATMKPGSTPLLNLAYTLLESMGADKALAEDFTREIKSIGVQAILARLNSALESGQTNWFLLIDQFEEIFRFGLNSKNSQIHQDAEDFVAILLRLAQQTEIPVYVCMTMRSDFLGDCDHFYQLPENMNRSQYLVPRLTREQRREAIAGPIHLVGGTITPRLLDRLLNESVDTRDDLPVLQHALMRTWDDWNNKSEGPIDVMHYENIKTVKHALSLHADEALQDLNKDQQKLAKRLFQCLTEVDAGNRRIRRPCHLSEIEQITGCSSKEIMRVINKFRVDNRNFLAVSSEQTDDDPLIDISHESLIRQWGTLTNWVDEEAESAKTYLRLAQTAELYYQKKSGAYRDAGLQLTLAWHQRNKPNAVWAKRYHKGFTEAEKFLKESKKIEDQEKHNKYQQQRKALFLTRLIAAAVFVFLIIAGLFAGYMASLKNEAEKKTLEASYHLAKVFEEKALSELNLDNDDISKAEHFQRALLYTTAALNQPIADDKRALDPETIGKLFNANTRQNLFSSQRWFSPHTNLGADVRGLVFSPDGKILVSGSKNNSVRVWDVASGREINQLIGHTDPVTSVAFSSDGRTIASGSEDNTVRLWDVVSGKELKQLVGHIASVKSVAFSPDGLTVVSGAWDKSVRLWDVASGKEIKQLNADVNSVAFSPDGLTMVSGADDNSVVLWDVSSGKVIEQLTGHSDDVTSVAFSPDGKTVASGSDDRSVRLWDVASGKEIKQLTGHSDYVTSVAFSPDGLTVVSGSDDNSVRLWDVVSGKEIKQLTGHSDDVTSVAFSPDGKTVASGSDDRSVRLWDVASGKEIRQLTGHTGTVTSVSISPDGLTVVSGSDDNSVRLWDVTSGNEINQLTGHSDDVTSVAFSPDGQFVVSASRDNSVRFWDVVSGKEIKQLTGHSDDVTSVAFSPDGLTVVSGSDDNSLRLWDVASGNEINQLEGHSSSVTSVAFSPDGLTVVSGSDDNSVRLWDVANGKEIKQLTGLSASVTSVAFSPDGQFVVSGSQDNSVRLWDVASGKEIKQLNADVTSVAFSSDGLTVASGSKFGSMRLLDMATGLDMYNGKEIKQLEGHTHVVTSVAFSPDGLTVVSGSDDNSVRLWDVANGKKIKQLTGPSASVTSVAFSPDGLTVVSGSEDNSVRLWDVASSEEIKQLTGHSDDVTSVAFSPDGLSVVSGSDDNSLRLWDVASGKESQQLKGHTNTIFKFALGTLAIERSGTVNSVAFSPDGVTVVSGSNDMSVRLWDVASGKEIKKLQGHTDFVTSVAYSPDGLTVVSGSGDYSVRLWDVASGKEIKLLAGHTGDVTSVSFCPDGLNVVSGSDDNTVRLWDVANGKEIKQLKGHTNTVNSVSFSLDGKIVVSGSDDNTARLWDVNNGEELSRLAGHSDNVYSVTFSPDGKTVFSGGKDQTVRLWDIATGEERLQLNVHSQANSVAFSPNGMTLIAGLLDGRIFIRNLNNFNLFLNDNKATETLNSFSRAGEFLWQLKLDGLEVKPTPWTPAIKPQDGYNFSYDKKFRPLLTPPKPNQTKFDQVLEWARQQAEKTTETNE